MSALKSPHPIEQYSSRPAASMGVPPLPRGWTRFALPLLLIAPMPLLSITEVGWQHMLHGRETRAIIDIVGRVPVGSSAHWSAPSLLPWSARIGGFIAVDGKTVRPDWSAVL